MSKILQKEKEEQRKGEHVVKWIRLESILKDGRYQYLGKIPLKEKVIFLVERSKKNKRKWTCEALYSEDNANFNQVFSSQADSLKKGKKLIQNLYYKKRLERAAKSEGQLNEVLDM